MSTLPLVFDAPKRGLPPRHLADLAAPERAEAVAALGEKPFRAKQLSNHYFSRLTVDPAAMTDIPAASRERLAAELLQDVLQQVVSHGSGRFNALELECNSLCFKCADNNRKPSVPLHFR
jgi:23S rRNA (adenine2503-C2)-methyltransferase